MGIVLLLLYIEIAFQKFGKHPVKLIRVVYKGISGPEELSWPIINEFDMFVFELPHCF